MKKIKLIFCLLSIMFFIASCEKNIQKDLELMTIEKQIGNKYDKEHKEGDFKNPLLNGVGIWEFVEYMNGKNYTHNKYEDCNGELLQLNFSPSGGNPLYTKEHSLDYYTTDFATVVNNLWSEVKSECGNNNTVITNIEFYFDFCVCGNPNYHYEIGAYVTVCCNPNIATAPSTDYPGLPGPSKPKPLLGTKG